MDNDEISKFLDRILNPFQAPKPKNTKMTVEQLEEAITDQYLKIILLQRDFKPMLLIKGEPNG